MAGVRGAVAQHRAARAPRRTAPRPRRRRSRRRAAGSPTVTPLANVIRSGSHVLPALDPEPRAEPAEAADHAVDHEQHAVLGAQVGDALDVAVGRRVDAAGADHRLAEERGHAVGPDAQDLGLERLQRVVLDRRDAAGPAGPSWSRSPRCRRCSCRTRACRGSPGCARSGACARAGRCRTQWRRAIFAAVSIASPPPEARNTRASSIGATAASRSASSLAGPVAEVAERRVRLELAHLRGDGVGDLRAAVAEVRVPEARGAVEVAVALGVEHVHALAALDQRARSGSPRPCRRTGARNASSRW